MTQGHLHPSPRAFYRPSLDGLRFFAFFAVFLHHSIPHDDQFFLDHGYAPSLAAMFSGLANAGAFGVDLFFVLSAYLITELLLRERDAIGTIDLKSFYIRRALRIWPLHYAFLGFALVLPVFVASEHLTWQYALGFAFFSGNWMYVFTTVPTTVAVLLWSVSVEEQFYLLWPLAVRKLSRTNIVKVALGMLVLSMLVRLALADADRDLIWNNTLARLDPLAAGIILAVALRGGALNLGAMLRACLIVGGSLALFAVTRVSGVFVVGGPVAGKVFGYSIATLACVSVFLGALRIPGEGRSLLESRWLVYLGRISYGLYVWHKFAILCGFAIFGSMHRGSVRFVFSWGASLLLTLLIAAVSYRWLEQPFLRLKQRFTHVESRPGG